MNNTDIVSVSLTEAEVFEALCDLAASGDLLDDEPDDESPEEAEWRAQAMVRTERSLMGRL